MAATETKILAIDPGVTTGVALVSPLGDVVRSETLQTSDLHILRAMLREHPDAAVLIEQGPQFERHNRPSIELVERVVEEDGREDVAWISPSQWKNSPTNKRAVGVRSKHVKDAVRMARWFQRFRRNSEGSGTQRGASRAHQVTP